MFFKKGKNLYLYSYKNKKFLDISQASVGNILGFSHPVLQHTLKNNINSLNISADTSYTTKKNAIKVFKSLFPELKKFNFYFLEKSKYQQYFNSIINKSNSDKNLSTIVSFYDLLDKNSSIFKNDILLFDQNIPWGYDFFKIICSSKKLEFKKHYQQRAGFEVFKEGLLYLQRKNLMLYADILHNVFIEKINFLKNENQIKNYNSSYLYYELEINNFLQNISDPSLFINSNRFFYSDICGIYKNNKIVICPPLTLTLDKVHYIFQKLHKLFKL